MGRRHSLHSNPCHGQQQHTKADLLLQIAGFFASKLAHAKLTCKGIVNQQIYVIYNRRSFRLQDEHKFLLQFPLVHRRHVQSFIKKITIHFK